MEDDDDSIDEILEESNLGDVPVESDITKREKTEVDFDEEAVVARKVLNSVISSSREAHILSEDISAVPKSNKDAGTDTGTDTVPSKSVDGVTESARNLKPGNNGKNEFETQDLQNTLFICNLPFDVNTEEVKERFSVFGEVKYFSPVVHHVTKYGSFVADSFLISCTFHQNLLFIVFYLFRRPKGSGFLKFKTTDAADAAISAASAVAGLGIILKGRQLKVMKALDKNSAHNIELEKNKKEDHDQRNLYLAKVCPRILLLDVPP